MFTVVTGCTVDCGNRARNARSRRLTVLSSATGAAVVDLVPVGGSQLIVGYLEHDPRHAVGAVAGPHDHRAAGLAAESDDVRVRDLQHRHGVAGQLVVAAGELAAEVGALHRRVAQHAV
nr:hypothetical protein [Dactylosporangium aurantiacum]